MVKCDISWYRFLRRKNNVMYCDQTLKTIRILRKKFQKIDPDFERFPDLELLL